MDKQDRSHVKVRPTTVTPHGSSVATPSDDILVNIRDDYRKAKKQLEQYNKFTDRHPELVLFASVILFFMALVAGAVAGTESSTRSSASSTTIAIGVFLASLALFLVSLVFVVKCLKRGSAVVRTKQKMKDLQRELVLYNRATTIAKDKKDISRDELGLYEESVVTKKAEETGESAGLISFGWITLIAQFFRSWGGLAILASVAALVISIILVASKNSVNKRNGKVILAIWIVVNSIGFIVAFNNAQQAQRAQNIQACMATANNAYDPTVPNAAQSLISETQACQSSNGQ